jgi:hypothetical protein
MKKRTLAVAALATLAFASCLKNNGAVDTPRAGILVDLLSPNATNTTVILNGNTIGTNVSFGSIPLLYNQVAYGNGNLSIFGITTAQLLNHNFDADPGKYYSIFVVDSVSKMKAIMVTDSVDYPGTSDSIKVRFYNFAPNSQGLSVRVKDSSTLWPFHPFETQSSADDYNTFIDMKAGTYTFEIVTPYSATSIKDTTLTFEGKHIYTLFTKGFFADTTGTTALGLGVVRHG